MLNNKGFAVSAVLYTTLIAFLLFLAVVLSMFSSSSDLVRNANTDLINGNKFEAKQVTLTSGFNGGKTNCVPTSKTLLGSSEFHWYDSPVIVKINSRYGTYYWPKDFSDDNANGGILKAGGTSSDGKLQTSKDGENNMKLIFTDNLDGTKTTVEINSSICDY